MATRTMITDAGSHMLAFDSMTDVVEYTDPSLFKAGRKEFVGEDIPDWTEADMKTKRPWEYGHDVLEAFVERLRAAALPELKNRARYTEWSFTDGDEVCYERMAQGLPYLRRVVRDASHGPSEMTVIIDTTTPCFRASDDVLWRGAAAIALTTLLEEKGYRVELWVVNGSQLFADDRRPVMTATCLKRTSDPLDQSTLVNTVSGWFYRSVTFTLLDTICKKMGHPVSFGYGSCAEPMPKDLDSISQDALRVYSSGVYTFSGALDLIVAEVQRAADSGEGKQADSAEAN